MPCIRNKIYVANQISKHRTDPQEEHVISGMLSTDPKFGIKKEELYGLLTTYDKADHQSQIYDPKETKYVGRIPTVPGRCHGYYKNIADVICGRVDLQVNPEQSQDRISIIELAQKSHETGRTITWS